MVALCAHMQRLSAGLLGVLLVYLIIGQGTGLVVNLIGFVYPAYKS